MKNILLVLLLLCSAAAIVLWLSPELRDEADELLKKSGLKSPSVTLYKWRDENGVWQYTQALPPDGVAYEEVEARSDVNVLPLPEELQAE